MNLRTSLTHSTLTPEFGEQKRHIAAVGPIIQLLCLLYPQFSSAKIHSGYAVVSRVSLLMKL